MSTNKIISFSLWGNNPKYTIGAIRNAELAKDIYPDWMCKFFVGSNTPGDIINHLNEMDNTILSIKSEECNWKSMFWRFETTYDKSITASIFRDCDSRLSMREKYAVDEWLKSDKTFHIMRDHPHHGYPILGGMWGFKHNSKYDFKTMMDSFDMQDRYGTDYEFFIKEVYPLIGSDKIVHDPFFEKIDFPKPRNGTEFVGDVFDENDVRHPDYWRYIK